MKNIKNVVEMFRKLNFIMDKEQKVSCIRVLCMIFISTILEFFGVSIILPFMQAMTNPDELMENAVIERIAIWLKITEGKELLIAIGVMMAILYILKNVFMIFSYYVQYDFASKVTMDLSIKMLNSYMEQPYSYFLKTNSSEILRGCSNDTEGVYYVLFSIIQFIMESLTVIVIGIYIIYTDWIIAVSIFAFLSLVLLFMVFVFKPIVKKIGVANLRVNAEKNKIVYQMIMGVKELFVLQRKQMFLEDYKKCLNENRILRRRNDTINASPDRITEGICVSGIIGIVIIRLVLQTDNMIVFIPELASFAMAAFKVLPSVGKITTRLNTIIYNMPALNNVYKNMFEAKENSTEKSCAVGMNTTEEKINFEKKIEINGVKWKYEGAENNVLSDVNIVINKGESVGLMGPSGSGKTTLTDILLGLLPPNEGNVLVDGVNVFTIPNQWAEKMGYVSQSFFLIDDTIRANVLFGLKDNNDLKVWEALEKAQLKEYVEGLPDQLDTIVGERGIKLSGGQRQRIAIARALYKNPQVLVLDEATAALDNDTEMAVMQAVESLHGKVTTIIIAHRLSTIRNCDKVYEIKEGIAIPKKLEKVVY